MPIKSEGREDGFVRALVVAVDGGPRETLSPLSATFSAELERIDDAACEHDAYWSQRCASARPTLLVVGTSDSAHGRRIEGAARRSARAAGMKIAAIEDFPGNYSQVEGGAADLLVVESDAAAGIAKARLGFGTPPLAVAAPARYAPHRARAAELRQATAQRWAVAPRPRVLWAGQPETSDCIRTLEALLPALRACNAELLFKAHPRDQGHIRGDYRELLCASGVDYCDLTAESMSATFERAPRLVATQFSSVALEAGFYGIPSVWALLPGAGGDRLYEKKGYRVPALCAAGGAIRAKSASDVAAAIARALDAVERAQLIARFDAYFETSAEDSRRPVQKLAERLRSL